MNAVRARRIVSSHKRGSSWPVVAETEEGRFLVKLRGAAQGTAPLVAEVIVSALADALGLAVPRRTLLHLDADVENADRDQELGDLLRASQGLNLGFRFLEGARVIGLEEAAALPDERACPTLWLDALVMNPDRTPENPNLLVAEGRSWLIDHGAALPFQYSWGTVTEESARSAAYALDRHLFAARADRLDDWDERLAGRLPREVLDEAIAQVPDDFLIPLFGRPPDAERLRRRRAAYQAFLWKRLKAPRPFVS
ncbi:MAG TPA: HipA family kinase [Vicinamibacteria bacterium]|nr:HipA family kinase [Vicinamibacteria bacterium]